jgi:DNA repair protein RecO (recombination protein O)
MVLLAASTGRESRRDDIAASFVVVDWRVSALGLLTSEAVVLRTYPLGNSDKIVVVYTRNHGKLRGVAKGARRIKNRFMGRLEPFNWIEMVCFEKENRDLVSIDKIELLKSFSSQVRDYRCFLQLNYLAELMFETTPDREPNDCLFRLLLMVLAEMQNPLRSDLAQLYFEVWHMKISGLFPPSKSCYHCAVPLLNGQQVFFSSRMNGFYCSGCKENSYDPVASKSYQLLHQILRKSLVDLVEESSIAARSELARVIEQMVEKAFERRFECLSLIRDESPPGIS